MQQQLGASQGAYREDPHPGSTDAGRLDWLLSGFTRHVPDIAHAVAVSGDGMLLARSYGLPPEQADQLAAVISGLASLTAGAAGIIEGGLVRQTIVDMDGGVMIVMAVGLRAVVGILADRQADLGQVGYETAMLVHRVSEALEPAARSAAP